MLVLIVPIRYHIALSSKGRTADQSPLLIQEIPGLYKARPLAEVRHVVNPALPGAGLQLVKGDL